MRIALLLVFALAACSGSSSKRADNAEPNGSPNADPNGSPNVAPNSGAAHVCGSGGACDGLSCRMCRYEAKLVAAEGGWPVAAFGQSLGIAFTTTSDGETVWFAASSAGDFDTEVVYESTTTTNLNQTVRLAIAPDDTPWVTFWLAESNLAHVTHRQDDGWVIEELPSQSPVAIAVTADETPWIAYSSPDGEVVLASRDADGTWAPTVLGPGVSEVALAAQGPSVAAVWLSTDEQAVRFATSDGAIAAQAIFEGAQPGALDVAWGAAGLAATHAGRVVRHDGAQWGALEYAGSGRTVGLTVGPDAIARLASAGSNGGLQLTEILDAGQVSQQIAKDCDEDDPIDAVQTDDGLVVVFACNDGVRMLRRTGLYPANYAAQCETLATALCDAATTCHPDTDPGSADVCLTTETRTHCTSASGCPRSFLEDVCGDASQAPELVDACLTLAPSAECWVNEMEVSDNDGGIVLPDGCPTL